MKYKLSLFIFRRDLRLADNLGLIAALQQSEKVLPCFILDPRQYKDNEYKGTHSLQFMYECLEDLNEQLSNKHARLYLFKGIAEKVIAKIISRKNIDAIYFNRDYTPFSLKRDNAIKKLCETQSIPLHTFDDALLNSPTTIIKPDKTPYQIFTRYYQQAKNFEIPKPKNNSFQNYFTGKINTAVSIKDFKSLFSHQSCQLNAKGGRNECLKKLKSLKNLTHYEQEHDFPILNSTTHLSPYLKFTVCSIREIYHAIKSNISSPSPILRQLYWRDFFTTIAFYFPQVFGHAYQEKYEHLPWDNHKKLFKAWCEGRTGFPIVDAGMRELNETGIMHNRVRLITASFLVKDLHIDWRWGEKYFAQKLLDYDPAVNNGNWQWVAGTGTDAQPYFRIFNPWLQQKKFDPDCEYIKRWVPELKSFDKKLIHQLYRLEPHQIELNYYYPIVNHKIESEKAKKVFTKIIQKI